MAETGKSNRSSKRASRPKTKNAVKLGLHLAEVGAGVLVVGRVTISIVKYVIGSGLLVAAAVGTMILVPTTLRKRIFRDVNHLLTVTKNEATERVRALGT